MAKKIVAIVGSYRKGGITDQVADAILESAQKKGAAAEKILLIDKHIEFCTNCRKCASDDPQKRRGECVLTDDMAGLLSMIDSADAVVFGSPINFGNVTAVMKRFVERLLPYTYWPWDKSIPKVRIKNRDKKMVVTTSSACPALMSRFLMPYSEKILTDCAEVIGAKVVKSLYFGAVCREEKQKLDKRQIRLAELAGIALV